MFQMRSSNLQKNTPETQRIALLCALLLGITVGRQCAGEGNVNPNSCYEDHSARMRGRQGF